MSKDAQSGGHAHPPNARAEAESASRSPTIGDDAFAPEPQLEPPTARGEPDRPFGPDDRLACLTIDLEDDWYFDDPRYDHLTLEYLDDFVELIDGLGVPLTAFVVGKTLEAYPEKVEQLRSALGTEFHLHTYQHDVSNEFDFEEEVRRGMRAYRNHFGTDPVGYRAQQGNIDPDGFRVLERLGFKFDSSVFPSYRPGVYNNLTAPTEPYTPSTASSLLEIPLGVHRGIRIPVSQSYFKLFGRPLSSYLGVSPLPNVVVYNVHLQDLYRTASHDKLAAPKRWIMKRNLERSTAILERNLSTLVSRGYELTTMNGIYDAYGDR
ncbi:polysaccharide deacetylase family protein [Natronococcus sp. A-GB7]|uniref:polysaccharide deacetylase family protein n=1 Tax=Natronococcus sp. A-GB7 TaxID=3037649 RepID=UPI00241F658A|nr:polysaccharide deacetylase family protein [Natronococcus sp. A-GB7]MDG5819739.1 polysaccharide deacetylase family protein [Natronococcus sp. A-GB7]